MIQWISVNGSRAGKKISDIAEMTKAENKRLLTMQNATGGFANNFASQSRIKVINLNFLSFWHLATRNIKKMINEMLLFRNM